MRYTREPGELRQRIGVLLMVAAGGASLGCGADGTTAASKRVPQVGTYAYSLQANSLAINPTTLRGRLVLTYADEDSVAGTLYAYGMSRTLKLGFYDADAYVLAADGVSHAHVALVMHRIQVAGQANQLSCTARHLTGNNSFPSPCTLTWLNSSTEPIKTPTGAWLFLESGRSVSLALDESGGTVTGDGSVTLYTANTYLDRSGSVQGVYNPPSLTFTIERGGFPTQTVTFEGGLYFQSLIGTLRGSGLTTQSVTLDVR